MLGFRIPSVTRQVVLSGAQSIDTARRFSTLGTQGSNTLKWCQARSWGKTDAAGDPGDERWLVVTGFPGR